MVEVSRDGRRVYVTNALHDAWDAQFYPDGLRGWMARLDAGTDGGLSPDPRFLVSFGDWRPIRCASRGRCLVGHVLLCVEAP